jgi:hypothetical protein
MQRGELDPSILARALGLDLEAGLFAATVFLAIDKVTAALGFRLAPADDVPPVSQESAATEAAPHAALKPFNFEAVRVELTVSKAFWENRGRPTPAPTQEDIQKLLKQRYDPKTWTRRHVRALHQIWPEEARRRGPRKPPRRNSRRK